MKKTGAGRGLHLSGTTIKDAVCTNGTTRRKRKRETGAGEAPEATLTEFPQINAGFPTADPGRPGNTEKDTR